MFIPGAGPLPAQPVPPESRKPEPRALGALGGEGILLSGEAAVSAGLRPPAAGVRVTSLIDGGAGARAGLAVGDVIVGAGSRRLVRKDGNPEGPFLLLTAALEAPRSGERPVELRVLRGRKLVKVSVVIPGGARSTRRWPEESPRAREILAKALAHLAAIQAPDGSFPAPLGGMNGRAAVTTIAGLAFLAAGSTPTSGKWAKQVRACRDWLQAHAGKEPKEMARAGGRNWSQVNWALGYAPLFLARDPREDLQERLEEIRDALVRNQEPSGGWGHGPRNDLPYPLDYCELTAVGNLCLAALGELRSIGIAVPEDAIRRAVAYTERTSDGAGGVGYSDRPGQKGRGSAGRTAGALLALSRLGLTRHPFFKKLASYFRRHLTELPRGHVSPSYHLFFGALASRVLGRRDWESFTKAYRLEILSLWNGDGTFGVRPADTSRFGMPNTDRSMGEAWRTATFAMILALPSGLLDGPAGSRSGKKGAGKK